MTRARPRRAYSLIELLMVCALTSLVLSSLAVVLNLVFRLDRQLRDEMSYAQALPRLTNQFRQDAHSAVNVTRSEHERGGVIFHHGEQQVEYRREAGGLLRIASRSAGLLHREIFLLSGISRVEWDLVDEPATLIRLVIDRQGAQETGPLRREVIEAGVGISLLNFRRAGAEP